MEMLKYLIGQGLDPLEFKQDNSLAEMAVKMGSINILKLVVERYGLGITYTNRDKENLLHLAMKSNHLAIVHYLINKKININHADKDKFTPLHYAV